MALFKMIVMIYAILMLGGGVMGFIKAQSRVSLIMGIVSAALLFIGTFLIQNDTYEFPGKVLVTAVSMMLCVVFAIRYMKTHAFMPSGMLFTVSFSMLIYSITQLFQKVWNP